MCGICGILRFDGQPVQRDWLERMNETMVDRGPDDSGVYLDRNFGMAIRRLSIIDLETGHQPIANEDGTIIVIMNGEIYNYIELRRDLEKNGHVFRTKTDTEVLVHLYEEYGTDCLQYVFGMFGFAIWDKVKRTLWIARDRFGIKPLVFFQDKNMFAFASTQTALTQLPGFEKSVDIDSLLLYFNLSYVPAPRSIWCGVQKLLPGEWLMVKGNSVEAKKYWDASSPSDIQSGNGRYEERIRELFHRSIDFNSRSDVPVGIFLSGGLDSTAVTTSYCTRTDKDVHTFTVDCEGKSTKEGVFAQIVSDRCQTTHHQYILTVEQGLNELDELLEKFDEPMGDSAIIPSYYLSKRASEKGIKVVLSGAGGDELFGGYSHHYRGRRDLLAGRFPGIPIRWSQNLSVLNSQILHYGCIAWDRGVAFGLSTSGANIGVLNDLLKDRELVVRGLNLVKGQYSTLALLEQKKGFQYGRMLTDINNYLSDNVLAVTDKTTMAASLEARVPLLDHRMAELIFSLPPGQMLGDSFKHAKKSLKSSLASKLPKEIVSRDKVGFNAPVSHWMMSGNSRLWDRLRNLRSAEISPLICSHQVDKLANHQSYGPRAMETLFKLYIADCWFEKNA